MNPRNTGLLALVAIALGAWIFFQEIEGDRESDAASEAALDVHPGLEAEEIERVSLTTLDGVTARFERREGRWLVVDPVEARADATALDAIVHALVNLPREGSVDAADDLEDFGLGADAQTVLFETGNERRGLRIGGTTPVGGHRYVVPLLGEGAADPASVAYVTSYRVNAFNRNFDDLRDRRPFSFEAGDVRTLRVAWPAGTAASGDRTDGVGPLGEGGVEVALALDDDGEWQLGSPFAARADQETMRELLSNLAYLRVNGFVDALPRERDESVRVALESTAVRFAWTVAGAHLEAKARIAGEVEGRRLLEGPDGRVYWLARERLEDFPRTLIAYRFKQLASFEVSAARRLEMEFVEEASGTPSTPAPLRVVATLEETGWSSVSPTIDPDRATRMVREMAGLEAYDIVADAMGPQELANLGLLPPRARLRVEGGPDPSGPVETLANLSIGRFDPDRGLFAQRAGDSTIFLLGAEAAEELAISAADYRAHFEVGAGSSGETDANDEFEAESGAGVDAAPDTAPGRALIP